MPLPLPLPILGNGAALAVNWATARPAARWGGAVAIARSTHAAQGSAGADPLPLNSLELLAELLAELLLTQQRQAAVADPLALLTPVQVLVESRGMEHWLRLRLAERHGIAMNLEFPMPSRFIWELARQLLGDEVPQQSPYSRELLCWRLDALLADERFAVDGRAVEANGYWGYGQTAADPLARFRTGRQAGRSVRTISAVSPRLAGAVAATTLKLSLAGLAVEPAVGR